MNFPFSCTLSATVRSPFHPLCLLRKTSFSLCILSRQPGKLEDVSWSPLLYDLTAGFRDKRLKKKLKRKKGLKKN
ncbi:hypothetical protein DU71_12000 [Methanosarcina mazei]|uniref:Uncharacterized protein n=1 Tax=Methanosarcina mazei TaxID=2209 RepID=A0A0F8R2Y3_METMZ|nr:hypothetical protein DU71_12000 [Methanosarcina mazei]KKH49161.1 hypothetical protein DU72_05330 [Methanosarcina mazei]